MSQFPCYDHLSDEPTTEEVLAAIKSMKNRKGAEFDGMPAEAYELAVFELSEFRKAA